MICPRCNGEHIGVIDTRPTIEGNGTRRRRECADCGYRFTTYEQTRSDMINTARQLLEDDTKEYIRSAVDSALEIVFEKNFGMDTDPKRTKSCRSL